MRFDARGPAFFITLFLMSCTHPLLKEDEPVDLGALATATPAPTATLAPSPDSVSAATEATPVPSMPPPVPEVFDSEEAKLDLNETLWKKISDEEGIQAYQRREEHNPYGDIVAFRGESVFPVPLVKIATVLSVPGLQKEWVDSLAEARRIDQKSKLESIHYNKTKVPWPFQDRDFVYRANVRVQVDPPIMLIRMKSIEDAREPPHEGVVRGEILLSYFYLKQLPNGHTKVVVEAAVDPKGAIPLWLVNASQKRWPHNTLKRLREVSLRPTIPVAPEIDDYFKKPAASPTPPKKRGNRK